MVLSRCYLSLCAQGQIPPKPLWIPVQYLSVPILKTHLDVFKLSLAVVFHLFLISMLLYTLDTYTEVTPV